MASFNRKREQRHCLQLRDETLRLRCHRKDSTFFFDGAEICSFCVVQFFASLVNKFSGFCFELGLNFKVVSEDGSALSVMNYHYYYV